MAKKGTRFHCPCCEKHYQQGNNLREHFAAHHPDVPRATCERQMLLDRYPGIDLDQRIQDYLDKKESSWTLKAKGYDLVKYLRLIGQLRSYGEELNVHRMLKYGTTTVMDFPNTRATMLERYGVDHPSKNPEIAERQHRGRLRHMGVENLYPAIKTLQLVQQIQKALLENHQKQTESE